MALRISTPGNYLTFCSGLCWIGRSAFVAFLPDSLTLVHQPGSSFLVATKALYCIINYGYHQLQSQSGKPIKETNWSYP
jgi:hypothetical protein